jgi:hypothetical protein
MATNPQQASEPQRRVIRRCLILPLPSRWQVMEDLIGPSAELAPRLELRECQVAEVADPHADAVECDTARLI